MALALAQYEDPVQMGDRRPWIPYTLESHGEP